MDCLQGVRSLCKDDSCLLWCVGVVLTPSLASLAELQCRLSLVGATACMP